MRVKKKYMIFARYPESLLGKNQENPDLVYYSFILLELIPYSVVGKTSGKTEGKIYWSKLSFYYTKTKLLLECHFFDSKKLFWDNFFWLGTESIILIETFAVDVFMSWL